LLPLLLLQVTRQVFEAAKGKLKVVGRAGVGVDNVDLAAATEVDPRRHTAIFSTCFLFEKQHRCSL
jgi:phosphoglycerate dehydrogenase-like enzyme